MSAPDFFFAVNAIFRHVYDQYGRQALVDYWRAMAQEYYHERIAAWRLGGLPTVADDWRDYFAREPQAQVEVRLDPTAVELLVHVCPAIKHLRDHGRDIVPYFCDHCDHTCGTIAQGAGLEFHRTGGMGSCRQRFTRAVPSSEETG